MKGIFSGFGIEREIFSTKYHGNSIKITEKGSVRTLKYNDFVYSRIDKDSLYTHEYWDFFMPLPYAYDSPRILMIGLGGGTIVHQFSQLFGSRLDIEIVELDSYMPEVYERFLGEKILSKVIIRDGAEYVSAYKSKYEIIILDAYDGHGNIPDHFLKEKFVEDAYNSLKDGGIFAVNCIGSMLGQRLDDFLKILTKKFQVYRLDTSLYTLNVVLICTKGKELEDLFKQMLFKMKVEGKNEFIVNAYESSKRLYR